MPKRPKITIVTPTYNAADDIEACILSVANQTYSHKEHLFVDGVSSDGTVGILKRFSAQYPHINFTSEKDNGIYDAMNKGIDLADGEWIYFLGADDVLHNDTVLEGIFNSEDISSFDVIYGNVLWGNTGNTYDGKFSLLKLMERNICHQAIFYKKSVFNVIGKFETKYKIWADWLVNLKAFSNDQVAKKYVDTIIARFALGGQSSQIREDSVFLQDKAALFAQYLPPEYIEACKKADDYATRLTEIAERDKRLADCMHQLAMQDRLLLERDNILSVHERRIQELMLDKEQLLNSLSWKLTKPLRRLAGLFFRRR